MMGQKYSVIAPDMEEPPKPDLSGSLLYYYLLAS